MVAISNRYEILWRDLRMAWLQLALLDNRNPMLWYYNHRTNKLKTDDLVQDFWDGPKKYKETQGRAIYLLEMYNYRLRIAALNTARYPGYQVPRLQRTPNE